jgi:D-alanyl-lipoteichoic acid acyltransferase DltB (MBOAT superfamily)
MLFYSPEYLFAFLPLTFSVYFFLLRRRHVGAATVFLAGASLFYYGWWNPSYLAIILLSVIFNYLAGRSFHGRASAEGFLDKVLLWLGILANVGLLVWFKYTDFFITTCNVLSGRQMPLLHIVLPLAISFFTFQQIAYLVDSYRGETGEYNFMNYLLFVTFFPQLIAGPIVHHAEMMPQFASRRNMAIRHKNVALGLFIFSMGLFKKIVIADSFAGWADIGFDQAPELNLFEAWAVSLSYTFQLYYDFSGYADMAIGSALLFNIRLPVNFNSPYKARSIRDFWRRWHITLSRFLRDYLYIPMGGSRKGNVRTSMNLLLTFLLAGLWHGAGWTFVLWGLLHGLAMVVHRGWQRLGMHMPGLAAWFVTFLFINASWVVFRARDWQDAVKVLKGMAGMSGIVLTEKWQPLLGRLQDFGGIVFGRITEHIGGTSTVLNALIAVFLLTMFMKNSMELTGRIPPAAKGPVFSLTWPWALVMAVLVFVSLLFLFFGRTSPGVFLYFNF